MITLGSRTRCTSCIAERTTGDQMVSFPSFWEAFSLIEGYILAQEFDPDRFIDERVTKYLIPNPFIFLPFNAGPRICLGQQFAYNEMSFFLVKLLQNFSSMSLDLTSQPPETRPPSAWKGLPGRKGVEEFYAKSHLTSYAYVS